MKILLISQFFFPEPNSPRGLEFAKALQEKGHKVTCVTAFPSYPDGEIYKGYNQRLCQKEIIEGVEVLRFPIYIDHSRSTILRFLSYFSFALSLLLIMPFFIRGKFDILFSYCPPISVPVACVFLNWFYESRLVIDIQDFWPDTLSSAGGLNERSFLYKVVSRFTYWTYKQADHISVISPGMKRKLRLRGFEDNLVTVIYNWSTAKESTRLSTAEIGIARKMLGFKKDEFIILFAGNIGQAQALDHVLKCFLELQGSYPNLKFYFYGGGVDSARLAAFASELALANVYFKNRVSLEEISVIQQAADVLFLHLKEDPLFEITIPSKLSGYLMLGKPIIGGLQGDAKDIIDRSKAGLSYVPENVSELNECIVKLLDMSSDKRVELGEAGHKFYLEEMSAQVGVIKFIDIFSVLNRSV